MEIILVNIIHPPPFLCRGFFCKVLFLLRTFERILHGDDQHTQRKEAAERQNQNGRAVFGVEDLDAGAGAVKREAEAVGDVDKTAAEGTSCRVAHAQRT